MAKSVGYDLLNLFVEKVDVLVKMTNGTSVVLIAGSLKIFEDPIIGKTKEGVDVKIYEADINNVIRA